MVEALYIAATQDKETAVAEYLEDHLTGRHLKSQRPAATTLTAQARPPTPRPITKHPLNDYDHLLNHAQTPPVLIKP